MAASKPRRRQYRTGSIFLPPNGKTWILQIYVNGKRHRESTGKQTKREAELVLKERMKKFENGLSIDAAKLTISDLMDAKLTANSNNDMASKADDEARWRLHLQPYFGGMKAANVTTIHIQKYTAQRLTEEIVISTKIKKTGEIRQHKTGRFPENATINRELALLRKAFNDGDEAGLVLKVPHFPMLAENNRRKGFLTDAQYDTLAAECLKHGVWLRTIMEIGATFGWRYAEIMGLRIRHIDLIAKCIRLDDSKNGDGREVALTTVLVPLLAACFEGREKDTDAPAFVYQPGHRHAGKPVKDFRGAWGTATTAAGCPDLLVHDLRRTGARNLRRAGVPESVVMKIGGWRTNETFRRYAIVDTKDMQDAMHKLEANRAEIATRKPLVAPEAEIPQSATKEQVQ